MLGILKPVGQAPRSMAPCHFVESPARKRVDLNTGGVTIIAAYELRINKAKQHHMIRIFKKISF